MRPSRSQAAALAALLLAIGCGGVRPGDTDASTDGPAQDARPDLVSTCAPCPECGPDEVCVGADSPCEMAPRCRRICPTGNECGVFGPCVLLLGATYAGNTARPVCIGDRSPCSGQPTIPPANRCGVCDAKLGGANERCVGADMSMVPIDVPEGRICGWLYRYCKNCRPGMGGFRAVVCDP